MQPSRPRKEHAAPADSVSLSEDVDRDTGLASELARGVDGVIARSHPDLDPVGARRPGPPRRRGGRPWRILRRHHLHGRPRAARPQPADSDPRVRSPGHRHHDRGTGLPGGTAVRRGRWRRRRFRHLDPADRRRRTAGGHVLRSPATSDELLQRLEDLAGLVSELIVSKTQYGDALVMARRHQPMTLAAELRWAMLPPTTFSGERVGLACVLEPAYEVAGDAFDYAFNDGVLHLAVMDAMGHGLEASRLANLATAAYRVGPPAWPRPPGHLPAHRRRPARPVRRRALRHRPAGHPRHPSPGILRWVNAGHPRPLLLRGGRFAVRAPLRAGACPLGLGGDDVPVTEVALEPNDAAPVLHRRHRGGRLPRRRALRRRPAPRPHPPGAGRPPDPVGDGAAPGTGGAGPPRGSPGRRRHHPLRRLAAAKK